jgi:tetratricopeptide (TPR) repeat protein
VFTWFEDLRPRATRIASMRLPTIPMLGLVFLAVALPRQALPQAGRGETPTQRAAALESAAMAAFSGGELRRAIQLWSEGIELHRQMNDPVSVLMLYGNISSAWNRLERPDSALEILRPLLSLADVAAFSLIEPILLQPILLEAGTAYAWSGRADSAVAIFRIADSLARAAGDSATKALHDRFKELEESWAERATVDIRSEDLLIRRRPTSLFRTLVSLAELRGHARAAATTKLALSMAFSAAGQPDSALGWARLAEPDWLEIGDIVGLGKALGMQAHAQLRLGRADSAQAIKARDARFNANFAETTELFQRVTMGPPDRRLDSVFLVLNDVLERARRFQFRIIEQDVLKELAGMYALIGRPDSAIIVLEQAVALAKRRGVPTDAGQAMVELAEAEASRGRPGVALGHAREGLSLLHRDGGEPSAELDAMRQLGNLHARLGNLDSAIAWLREGVTLSHERAEEFARRLAADHRIEATPEGDREELELLRSAVVRATLDLGNAFLRGGGGVVDSAAAAFQDVVRLHRLWALESQPWEALGPLASLQERAGRSDSALALYRNTLETARAEGYLHGQISSLLGIAGVLHRSTSETQSGRALAHMDSAMVLLRRFQSETRNDATRLSLAEMFVAVHDTWLEFRLDRSRLGESPDAALEALGAVEQSRARSLLALMRLDSSAAAVPDLVEDGRRLASVAGRTGATVVSYYVTGRKLFGTVIRAGGEVRTFEMPATAEEIGNLVASYRSALGVGGGPAPADSSRRSAPELERGSLGSVRQSGSLSRVTRELEQSLFPGELAALIESGGELVIIPHGPLALIPFAALSLPGDSLPLGARLALRFAPSLTVLEALERRPAGMDPGRALVVGNPVMPSVHDNNGRETRLADLPGAAEEAVWIARRMQVPSLRGAEATETVIRARLPEASLVHLATHGFAFSSDARSRESFVALAAGGLHDGLLTVGEILDDPSLQFVAELVVLSACQTGLGDLKRSEGTVGLQRAFLSKGARSLLVSLWSVSDAATALLMRRFYTHWLDDSDKPSKAEALRRAQGDVRATKEFAHPRFWAAFQLVGAR